MESGQIANLSGVYQTQRRQEIQDTRCVLHSHWKANQDPTIAAPGRLLRFLRCVFSCCRRAVRVPDGCVCGVLLRLRWQTR